MRIYLKDVNFRDHGRVEGKVYFNTEVAYKVPFNLQAALGYAI